MKRYLWVSWERQRRSFELSRAFNAELIIIECHGLFRYFISMIRTCVAVRKARPEVLFVQNPSLLLALFAVFVIKPFYKVPIIVDRHSNFQLCRQDRRTIISIVTNIVSDLTIIYADLTIVTNFPLYHHVKIVGGKPFILHDKLPMISKVNKELAIDQVKKLFIISSFGIDEPFETIWSALRITPIKDFSVYVSGNYNKLSRHLISSKPDNVIFTGFIPDEDFDALLRSADAVMVLTSVDYVLLCGCYEAVAANKPLITSNTYVLKDLFRGATFVDSDPQSISSGICEVFENIDAKRKAISELQNNLTSSWNDKFSQLNNVVKALCD